MFKENQRHFQLPLTSQVDELPPKLRKHLDTSWSGAFYRDFFCRLDETPFAVLYADCPSRPNIPVNILVGLEYLKAGNGWSDEEMLEEYGYNTQVRYALGLRQLGEGDFDERTLYYFRERLSRYMQETGINLLEKAFEKVTDQQIAAYQLKTGKQRTPALAAQVQVWTAHRLPAIFVSWGACSCWWKCCSAFIACSPKKIKDITLRNLSLISKDMLDSMFIISRHKPRVTICKRSAN
jgi:hypothetical protein